MIPSGLASEAYCYVTTTGRRTGRPHTIEIWFSAQGDTLYILAGGRDRSDTVRNVRKNATVKVRIGSTTFAGRGRILDPDTGEDALARKLLLDKYAPGYGGDLTNWSRTALPVAIDLSEAISVDPAAALWPKGSRRG